MGTKDEEKNGHGRIALGIILCVLGAGVNLFAISAFNTVRDTGREVTALRADIAELRRDLKDINARIDFNVKRLDDEKKNGWDWRKMLAYAAESERKNITFKAPDVRQIMMEH